MPCDKKEDWICSITTTQHGWILARNAGQPICDALLLIWSLDLKKSGTRAKDRLN